MSTTEYFREKEQILVKEILALEAELKGFPDGTLVCYKVTKSGTEYSNWYKKVTSKDGKPSKIYIPKSERETAEVLAKKMYNERLLKDKKNELASVRSYLKHRKADQYSKMLDSNSPYRELLFDSDSWEYGPYEKSQDHPEHLVVPAPKGEKVRSKAEAMIAQTLFNHRIPYRYECVHDFGGYQYASDFTILHPKTYIEHIWEHFGLADDPHYINTNIAIKIPRYLMNGYLPGYNFIMTFEDNKHPLSYMDVEEIIEKYFLR